MVAYIAARMVFAALNLDLASPPLVALAVCVSLTAAIPSLPFGARVAAAAVTLAIIEHQVGALVSLGLRHIATPPEWDITVFWIEAQVAASGQNFYDPANAQAIGRQIGVSDGLLAELFFWYPPVTMLLFLPLGLIGLEAATAAMYIASAIAAAGCAWLLWRLFLDDAGPLGLLTATAMLLLARPALSTVFFVQTNFVLLFFLLLFWRQLRTGAAGVWFVLANVVKPALLPLALLLVARSPRIALGTTATTALALGIAALVMFGPGTLIAYLSENPTQRAPEWLYAQDVNQSLLGVVLRATGEFFSFGSPLANYAFLNIAACLAAITVFVCLRRTTDDSMAVAILVTFGLLVYPGTLEHYALLLLGPMLLMWHRRDSVPGAAIAVVAFVAGEYLLLAVADGQRTFVATLLAWLALTSMAVLPAILLRVRWLIRRLPPLRGVGAPAAQ